MVLKSVLLSPASPEGGERREGALFLGHVKTSPDGSACGEAQSWSHCVETCF